MTVPSGRLAQWVRERHPEGPKASWWNAILEAALLRASDLSEDVRTHISAAGEMLRLAESTEGLPAHYIADWYVVIAKKVEQLGLSDAPEMFAPDLVARRTLSAMWLSPVGATAMAERQQSVRLRELSEGTVSDEPVTPDDSALTIVRWLVPSLDWLASHVTDAQIKGDLLEWLLVRDRLALGTEVAELNRLRLDEVTRTNRLHELRVQAARGKTALEMADWLQAMLGRKFSFDTFSDYFAVAFDVEPSRLQSIRSWYRFGTAGELSDVEFDAILRELLPAGPLLD